MTLFSYLSFLTSIVLALGITRLITGFGRLLEARRQVRLYWVHLVWMLNVFLFQVLNWWILFRWASTPEWTFFLFLFVLLSPIISFLLSVFLIPDRISEGADLKRHFHANQRWFFVLGALLAPIDAIDTLLKGVEHFNAQGPIYVIFLTLVFVLNLIAAVTRREWYHRTFAVFFLMYLLAFIAINLRVLS